MNAARTIASLNGKQITAGAEHLGDIVSWNHRGVDLPRRAVRECFAALGADFAAIVEDIDATQAMGKARLRCRDKSVIVTLCKRPNADTPAAMMIERELEQDGEDGVRRVYGARTRVQNDHVVVAPPPRAEDEDEACMGHARAIASCANHLLDFVAATDLGNMLVAAVLKLGGFPMRDAGGFYFVPGADRSEKARDLLTALACLSGGSLDYLDGTDVPVWSGGTFVPIVIPAADSPAGLATVATGARDSLQGALSELSEQLRAAREKGGFAFGTTITKRIDDCEQLMATASLYRGVLAGFVDVLDSDVAQLRAAFQAELDAWKEGRRPGQSELDECPIIEEE